MSQWLTQKEPVRYTNKLIKKTTDTKLQRILAVNKKNLILANITMNDNVRLSSIDVDEIT